MIYITALLLILALVFESLVLRRGLKSARKNAAWLRNGHAALNTSRAKKQVETPLAEVPPPSAVQQGKEPAERASTLYADVIEFPDRKQRQDEHSLQERDPHHSDKADGRDKSVHDMIQEIRGNSPLRESDAQLPGPRDFEEIVPDQHEGLTDSDHDDAEELDAYEDNPAPRAAHAERTISLESYKPVFDPALEEQDISEIPETEDPFEPDSTNSQELEQELEEAKIVPSPDELLKDGIHHVRQGKVDEGIAALEQAAAAAPEKAEAHFNLGIAYTLQELYPAAIRSYQKAIALDPQYGKAFFNLGTLYLKQGQTQDAIEKLEKAASFLGNPMKALWNLYEAYRGSESFSNALAMLERLIELEPDDASLHNHLGICYAKLGQYPEAIQAWQRSVSLGASSRLIFYNLGKTYELCNNPEQAIEQYERFLQLDSQRSQWTELIEDVEKRLEFLQKRRE
ncbi:hypothetical protein CSB45_06860 [candidate division KSB3 bacterium]|uniref:Uncharacterized protein n=1 Tax=candidate division KSB3 bacterium TaxID=2044937 RepID=A0A2G6E6M1_9BACT|nr:MAG: hypothetical protein CSB45_06860 [candidate division KSB3 bacterium]PIE30045.1 MAG: hypothetical protein CSA57_05735 [candidate division KSB3 bacterium]